MYGGIAATISLKQILEMKTTCFDPWIDLWCRALSHRSSCWIHLQPLVSLICSSGPQKYSQKKTPKKNRPNDWCSSGKINQITLYKQTMSFGWTSSNNPSPTTKHAKAWRPWQSVTVTRRNPWNCLLVFWYPILKTVGIQKSFFVAHVHIRFVMYGNLISRWPGTHQSSISPTQNPLFHERVPTLLILTDLLTAPTPEKTVPPGPGSHHRSWCCPVTFRFFFGVKPGGPIDISKTEPLLMTLSLENAPFNIHHPLYLD